MEKNNLLNLLLAGGIAVAIALGGAGLGVALNKSKSEESTSSLESGILGVYGGFKTLAGAEEKVAKQAILGIEVDASKTDSDDKAKAIGAGDKEIEILDLSKTIGNLEWIKKQFKNPNVYTKAVSKKILHDIGWKRKIKFFIETKTATIFNTAQIGTFDVEVSVAYTAAVKAEEETPAKAESWNYVYKLGIAGDEQTGKKGIAGLKAPKQAKSDIFKVALTDKNAILKAGWEVIFWKASGSAANDGTDAEIIIILQKETGKVFLWSKTEIEIVKLAIYDISVPAVTIT